VRYITSVAGRGYCFVAPVIRGASDATAPTAPNDWKIPHGLPPRLARMAGRDRTFAENLERAFYGFESDFFQQNASRIVDDVVSQIQGALELWPTLVEICYFQRHTKDLPRVKVANVHLGAG
jgi:hypothetical protein